LCGGRMPQPDHMTTGATMEFEIRRVFVPECDQANAINAADCLRCAAVHGQQTIDWKAVNLAIVQRWPKGLSYIETRAWRLLKEKPH
jgi:hypothetical protein